MSFGLLLLRLALGLTLAAHGSQKLFGWFGGHGLKATSEGMGKMGFVPAGLNGLLAGLTEFGGGVLLALGLATPIGAALGFSVMVVAGVGVHLKNGFFLQNRGYEYNVVLGLGSLSLAFTGAGSLSLDALCPIPLGGPAWGLGALVVGLVGAGLPLALRRPPPVAATPASTA